MESKEVLKEVDHQITIPFIIKTSLD